MDDDDHRPSKKSRHSSIATIPRLREKCERIAQRIQAHFPTITWSQLVDGIECMLTDPLNSDLQTLYSAFHLRSFELVPLIHSAAAALYLES